MKNISLMPLSKVQFSRCQFSQNLHCSMV